MVVAEFEIDDGAGWRCLVGESLCRWVVGLVWRKLFAISGSGGGGWSRESWLRLVLVVVVVVVLKMRKLLVALSGAVEIEE
jgi:hypothetical protein